MEKYSTSELNKVRRGANRATYDKERINQILDDGFIGFVSFIYDGKAINLPMAYGREENKIYLHGSLKNRMLLSLIKAGSASMTVMHLDALVLARSGLHHSVNYRSVTVFGNVLKVEDDLAKTKGLKCVVDHMMVGRWEGIRPMLQKELNGTLVVELIIETASAKVRDVGVKDETKDLELDIWAGLVPIRQIAEYPISDELLPPEIKIPKHVLDYFEENK